MSSALCRKSFRVVRGRKLLKQPSSSLGLFANPFYFLMYFNGLSDTEAIERCQICNESQKFHLASDDSLFTPPTRFNPTPKIPANLLKWHEFKLGLKSISVCFFYFCASCENALSISIIFNCYCRQCLFFPVSLELEAMGSNIAQPDESRHFDISLDGSIWFLSREIAKNPKAYLWRI